MRSQMKKLSRKSIIKKLDKAVSDYIIKRDKKCVICSSAKQLTNGHLFSRRHNSLRWDIRRSGNCHAQCWGCNYKHTYNTYPYNRWFIKKFGENRFNELYEEWNKITILKTIELAEMYKKIYE